MLKFGCSTTLGLKDALAFARHYRLDLATPVRRSETLRRVARASAIVHCKHILACLWWRDQEEIFGLTASQRMLERYYAEERSADHFLK